VSDEKLCLLKDFESKTVGLENIHLWDFIKINEAVRLYYKAEIGHFDFFAFKHVGVDGMVSDDELFSFNPDITYIECLFHGAAYYDGMRHLYMGHESTGDEGYLFYPQINELILCLRELKKLELKYCSEDQIDDKEII
jgi:hypothetical protein